MQWRKKGVLAELSQGLAITPTFINPNFFNRSCNAGYRNIRTEPTCMRFFVNSQNTTNV
jgi:hypothetical protein